MEQRPLDLTALPAHALPLVQWLPRWENGIALAPRLRAPTGPHHHS